MREDKLGGEDVQQGRVSKGGETREVGEEEFEFLAACVRGGRR